MVDVAAENGTALVLIALGARLIAAAALAGRCAEAGKTAKARNPPGGPELSAGADCSVQ